MKKRLFAVMMAMAMVGSVVPVWAEEEDNSEKDWEYKEANLTLLIGTAESWDGMQAVCDLAEEELGITVEFQNIISDEQVKTLLVSGDMCDILAYQSGALLSALNPSEYFIDLSDNAYIMGRLDDSFTDAVTVAGATYGVPKNGAKGGGILYNKAMYEEYGLEVPTTWAQFLENCNVLQEAGEVAVIGSFADSWTTQFPFLADNANVLTQDMDFADNLTAGTDSYAENEYALRSFEKLTDLTQYYNEDYVAATYNDACDMLAEGQGAQYCCSTMVLSSIYSLYGQETIDNIGFFAIPADNEEDTTLTTWLPDGLYGNKNSDNYDDIVRFLEFFVSDEALDAYTSAILPDGPYCIKGYTLPENAYETVKTDLQTYFDEGKTQPAMEFLTDVKGASCASICQEAGSGQTTAEEAAAKYDDDCKLQAQQLGYDWAQ